MSCSAISTTVVCVCVRLSVLYVLCLCYVSSVLCRSNSLKDKQACSNLSTSAFKCFGYEKDTANVVRVLVPKHLKERLYTEEVGQT